MPPSIILADRVAIVTGGRRQLGAAQAIRLAECGTDVCLADIDHDDSMTATAAAIERLGRKALPVVCDVRRRDRMVEACAAELGGVDILVNNAGISSRETLMEVTDEEWDAVFDTHLKGMVLCTQYAARTMIAQGRGGAGARGRNYQPVLVHGSQRQRQPRAVQRLQGGGDHGDPAPGEGARRVRHPGERHRSGIHLDGEDWNGVAMLFCDSSRVQPAYERVNLALKRRVEQLEDSR